MKQILAFILFSFIITSSHSQVLKDFRITKCYYDSTDLYFEYEFVANQNITILENDKHITTCYNESYEVAVLANKYDSIEGLIKIPCNISCFLGYGMIDIDGNLFGRNEVIVKKDTLYRKVVTVALFDLLIHGDTTCQLKGKYTIQLIQPIISFTKRFNVERRIYSKRIEIDLPDYSTEFLVNKRFKLKQ